MDKRFTSDGCSGGMSWAWRALTGHPPPWEKACIRHDQVYWRGGSARHRLNTDRILMQAIIARGYPHWAYLIYLGVRLGGVWWLPTPWRWGYGWYYPQYKGEKDDQ